MLYEYLKNNNAILIYIICLIFLGSYIYMFLSYPPIVHSENTYTMPFMATYGQDFIIDLSLFEQLKLLVIKSFDLTLTEGLDGNSTTGFYRPRILSFFLQYIDSNLFILLSKYSFPSYARLPGYWFSFVLYVSSVIYFCRKCLPSLHFRYALMLAACFPLLPSYQFSSYLLLRSAKLITPSVIIFIITFFIRNIHSNNIKFFRNLSISILLSILSTIDEQVFATILFLCILSWMFGVFGFFNCLGFKYKNVPKCFAVFTIASVLYIIYHLYIGKIVFSVFTPHLFFTHPHLYTSILDTPVFLDGSFEIYNRLLSGSFGQIINSNLVIILTIAAYIYGWFKCKDRAYFYISAALTLFSFLLLAVLIAAHPAIRNYDGLYESQYTIVSISIYLCALLILLYSINNRILSYTFLCFFICSSIVNIIKSDTYYNRVISLHGIREVILSNENNDDPFFRYLKKGKVPEIIFIP